MADWDAALYLKFEAERTQPAADLAGRLRHLAPQNVLDVGCGPGNSTAVLAGMFPEARVLGVDSSPNMVEAAAKALPACRFSLCDAATDLPALGEDYDIVFSNACIQWVPNHPQLLRDMLARLKKGGTLAVQTPVNERMQQLIAGVAKSAKWAGTLPQTRIFHNLTPEGYCDVLGAISAAFTLWQTTYFHCMPSHAAIIEWYRGTGLRPYLSALPKASHAAFEADVLERLRAAYPVRENGEVLFPFPRLFFTAVR